MSLRRDRGSVAQWNAAVAAARAVAEAVPLPNGERVVLDNFFPLDPDDRGDIAPGGPCPFLGQEVWVSAEGRFDPCCAPDAQRRTLGEFGDLHHAGLMEIWQGEPYRDLLRTYRNRALCLGCNMRGPPNKP